MIYQISCKPSDLVFSRLFGTIVFETESGDKYTKDFSMDNPAGLKSDSFMELLFFQRPLLELIMEIYGSVSLNDIIRSGRYPGISEEATKVLLERKDASKETISMFIDMLKSDDKNSVAKARESLIKIGSSAVEPLISLLKYDDVSLRERAVQILGKIGDARAVEPLLESLRDKAGWSKGMECLCKDDRGVIANALGAIGKPAVLPTIKFLEGNNDAYARVYAVWALGDAGDSRAVRPLADILKSAIEPSRRVLLDGDCPDPDIYKEAAVSLARIGKPALSSLAAISMGDNLVAKQLADNALKQIQSK
jgi:HEAT repeat protein